MADRLFLDFMLMKVRAKTTAYATMKNKRTKEKEHNLEHDIATLEKKENKKEDDISLFQDKNQEIILIREKKMEGVLLRSKARWVAEGEKITNYFCNLEKRNFTSKRMTKLTNTQGIDLEEPQGIKSEVKGFYERLYKFRDRKKLNK